MRKLRIAQLVLPWLSLPVKGFGGTERVVYNITEELVKRGHDVTLFSVGESKTSAKLEYIFNKPYGLQKNVVSVTKGSFYPWIHVAHCFKMHKQFDIIHSHAQFNGLPFAEVVSTPVVHTFHRLYKSNDPDRDFLLKTYKHQKYISISNSQRIPELNFIKTVYNGVDTNMYAPVSAPSRNFMLWVGRVMEEKGPLDAIQLAKKMHFPLRMAGKIMDQDYFKKVIEKEIDGKLIQFLSDGPPNEILNLYQNAKVTIMPTKWNEPFGLVAIESLACETPVISYNEGGVREIIRDGVTGFLVPREKGMNGLEEAYHKLSKIDPKACRQDVIDKFSIEKMVSDYEQTYYEVIDNKL